MSEVSKKEDVEEQRNRQKVFLYIDDWSEPKINDPALVQDSTVWRGANEISFKLLRCLEAIRDLSNSMDTLSRLNDLNTNKRLVKQLASPLYVLASGIRDMFNELESNAKSYTVIASPQHKEIISSRKKQFTVDVPIDNRSDLRVVRDKLDSHIDKDAVMKPQDFWLKVDLCSFLKWIGACLEQILYLLSLDVYGWTRESGHPDVWSLMSVDGTVVDFYMQNDKPVNIKTVTLVKSPKHGVVSEIKAFIALYNQVARKCEGIDLIMISEVDKAESE